MVIMVLLLLLKMNECVLRAQACQRAAHIKMHKIINYIGSDPRWFRAFYYAYFTKKIIKYLQTHVLMISLYQVK